MSVPDPVTPTRMALKQERRRLRIRWPFVRRSTYERAVKQRDVYGDALAAFKEAAETLAGMAETTERIRHGR